MPRAPKNENNEFGTLKVKNIGGRPPKPRVEKISFTAGSQMLRDMEADKLVDMLEDAGGDIELFASSFDRRNGRKEVVLTKVIFILSQDGNEEHLKKWDKLIQCNKQARMALLEKDHLKTLESMPKPDKKTPLREWLTYGNFWTGDMKEVARAKAKTSMRGDTPAQADKKKKEAAVLNAIEQMVAGLESAGRSEDEQQS